VIVWPEPEVPVNSPERTIPLPAVAGSMDAVSVKRDVAHTTPLPVQQFVVTEPWGGPPQQVVVVVGSADCGQMRAGDGCALPAVTPASKTPIVRARNQAESTTGRERIGHLPRWTLSGLYPQKT
jgi:hypothetical protein